MKTFHLILSLAVGLVLTSFGYAQIQIASEASGTVPMDVTGEPVGTTFIFNGDDVDGDGEGDGFDTQGGDLLVVVACFEGGASDATLSFAGGTPVAPVVRSARDTDSVNTGDQTAIFVMPGATGTGEFQLVTNADVNFPGFYVASLTGADSVEASGSFSPNPGVEGDLTGTITGTSNGAFVIAAFADQLAGSQNTDVTTSPADILVEVEDLFNSNDGGDTSNVIGSAIGSVATGFSSGADFDITFTDNVMMPANAGFQNRSNFSYLSISAAPSTGGLLGDVNGDDVVDFLDIGPFVTVLTTNGFQFEADINGDTVVDFLDISPFVSLLTGS